MKTGNGFATFTRFIDIPKACGKIKLRAAIKCVILLKKKVTQTLKLKRRTCQVDHVGKAQVFEWLSRANNGRTCLKVVPKPLNHEQGKKRGDNLSFL